MQRLLLLLFLSTSLPSLAPGQLIFSEVVEGNGTNFKWLEIYNAGDEMVDLTSPQITLRRYANGVAEAFSLIELTGSIAPGDYFVIANNASDFNANVFGFDADQYSSSITHNGDDSYDLFDGTTVLDGYCMDWVVGVDPGAPAPNAVMFRVNDALPNNGDWGGSDRPDDNTTCASGYWHYIALEAGNANALDVCTPGRGGGATGIEVPGEISMASGIRVH